MPTIDEQIGQALQVSLQSGELSTAKSWGKPLEADTAFANTPEPFRLPFKILKDSGFVPAEVALLNQVSALRAQLETLPQQSTQRMALERTLAELRLKISIRLEAMRDTGNL